ncbi:glutamine--fructose-6-phosphate transaminase (isomerizing) [Lapidilactobacillus gannanensis]|jgi:glucosamine--fructose-6-phosphate aminotransferase (isomerizing)|uniref:Glutamine--fructose-6-phosphate aminotransferase [isomerizing] n=1 Tax=Lapidilactobacillus gannanensis TaxID=2486002 RepID=A0ABW4BNX7_9LACO|nr:glutamine--fructose-6-phosphate transaminase (isomerizing) [Lapidilactobacillus gannanensis]MCH4057709.1 glutamine--fructose-6-phosphate transaminase (isomerizing) [Lactobacillaceae bacterium]
MCGIVGAIGYDETTEILLKGLERLEYRGYDSAGLYVNDQTGHDYLVKTVGKIAALRAAVDQQVNGQLGIAHTRWATHGQPSEANAHPQFSTSQRFYLVHNGVISNFTELKQQYLPTTDFVSQTDTEVLVQLVAKFVEQEQLSTLAALQKTLQLVNGSYALILVDRQQPDRLYVAKNKSPLLIGLGQQGNLVTSDALATYDLTDQYLELHDQEIAIVTAEQVQLMNLQGVSQVREAITINVTAGEVSKGAYPTFMLKEIDEQPAVMRRISQEYLTTSGQPQIEPKLLQTLAQADRLYFVAAGTSYHASLVGKRLFEKYTQIPAEVGVASEFGYHWPILSQQPVFIFLSQSGETADSRQVLIEAKRRHLPTLVITNVANSTLARESDYSLVLHAGPEIAVASTKAYTAQIAVEAVLAKALGEYLAIPAALAWDLQMQLSLAANGMATLVDDKQGWADLAANFLGASQDAFYLGRGIDYDVSLEAALKLKEISYVHTEGFAAGELKHGTIALIEQDVPVITFITERTTASHTRGNVQEVLARGAQVLVIASEACQQATDQIVLPELTPELMPLLTGVCGQLLAYYATLQRGLNVDQPRNLAKSVTVE